MTSSPTREEVEALAAWHDRRADVVPPYRETHGLHIRTSATLRALLARAEAAETTMRGAVTAAANADAERDAARAEAARLREEGRREEREACVALLESMRAAHNTAMIGVWHTPDTAIAYGKAAAAIRARSEGKR